MKILLVVSLVIFGKFFLYRPFNLNQSDILSYIFFDNLKIKGLIPLLIFINIDIYKIQIYFPIKKAQGSLIIMRYPCTQKY